MIKRHLPEVIETDRLQLSKHELSSAPLMFEAVESDRLRLREFLPWVDYTATVEDEYAYLHQSQTQWDLYEVYDYTLRQKSDGAYLGNFGVHNISWLGGSCELGYWILGEFEGQGFITESARKLCEILFARGFNRIEIRCTDTNARSAQVARRLNFRREARLRQSTANHGQFEDVFVFAMLRSEWGRTEDAADEGVLVQLEHVSRDLAVVLLSLNAQNVLGTSQDRRDVLTIRFENLRAFDQWKSVLKTKLNQSREIADAWTRVQLTFARTEPHSF